MVSHFFFLSAFSLFSIHLFILSFSVEIQTLNEANQGPLWLMLSLADKSNDSTFDYEL